MIELLFVASNLHCNELTIPVPIHLEVSYQGKVLNYLSPGQFYTYAVDDPDELDIVPLLSLPKGVEKCDLVDNPKSLLVTHDSVIPDWVHSPEFLQDYQKYIGPGQALIAAEFTSVDPSDSRHDFNDIVLMFQKVNYVPLPSETPEVEISLGLQ